MIRYAYDMENLQLGTRLAAVYELQSSWLEPRLRHLGVRWTTFQLLAAIMGAGEAASQAEISRRLGIAPATLSESVQAHVAKGLITQEPSPHDRRVKVLVLTDLGQRLMARIGKYVKEAEERMTRGLTAADARIAARVLDQMIANLERPNGI